MDYNRLSLNNALIKGDFIRSSEKVEDELLILQNNINDLREYSFRIGSKKDNSEKSQKANELIENTGKIITDIYNYIKDIRDFQYITRDDKTNNKKNNGLTSINNKNEKNGSSINNNQRPNSSRALPGKGNNIMDKKLNVNKYLELQSQYININMNNQGYSKQINNKINLNQGKNFGPYVKIMRTKKFQK